MGVGRISFALAAILCGPVTCAFAALTPQPASLTFPDTPTGASSAPQTLNLTNTGGNNVTINDIVVGGMHAGDFALSNGPGFPLSLVPNAGISIDCTFSPTLGGARNGLVQVVIAGMMATVDVPVSGKGLGPKITVAPSPIVAGNLPFGQMPAPVVVTVSNAGGSNVSVSSVTLSGPDAARFSLSGLPGLPKVLGPMQSFPLNVQFTPNQPGIFSATLVVNSTDPMTPVLQTPITGRSGDPKITLDIGTIIFGNQRVGIPSVSQDVNISNTGLSDLHVTALALAGNNPGDFSITVKPMLPATLPVGQATKISVVFTPSMAGARSAQVVITNDDPSAPSKTLPVTGAGTTPMASVMPNKLDFGNVKITTTGGANFTIANAGTGPVKVNTVTVTGPNAALFTVPMMAPFSVPAMGQVVVQVNFKPIVIGNFTATLNLTTDDPNLPAFALPLTGSGTSPVFSAMPGAVDFGSVPIGMMVGPQTVTLANTGNQPLTIMSFLVNGPDVADYTITGAPMAPLVLQPGTNTKFNVSFKPTINGAEIANVNLTTDDPRAVAVNITLRGFGRQPRLTVTPLTGIDFGVVQVGDTSMPKELIIGNTGTADLDVSTIKVIGAMGGPFSTDSTGGFMVAANDAKKIFVKFAPTAMGSSMAQIEIKSSNQGVMAALVDVKGTGVSPMISATPTALDFGPIVVGETAAPLTITIHNNGTKQFIVDRLVSTHPAFGPTMNDLNMPVEAKATLDLVAGFTPTEEGDVTAQLQVYLKGSTVPAATVMAKGSGVTGGKMRSGGCSLGRGAAATFAPLTLLLALGLLLRSRRVR